jgi:hypothetical protein
MCPRVSGSRLCLSVIAAGVFSRSRVEVHPALRSEDRETKAAVEGIMGARIWTMTPDPTIMNATDMATPVLPSYKPG